jgi:phosphonate transport system substrate-binding protein
VGKTVAFGVVPTGAAQGAQGLEHLVGYLSDTLGRRVVGVQADSYSGLVSALERGKLQFAWMPPLLLVLAQERIALQPLVATVRKGQLDYRAVLFSLEEAPHRGLADFRGRTVAWVDRTSAAGYLYPRLHLASRGIDPDAHFGAELLLGSHTEVVRAVDAGRADVGATFAVQPPLGTAVQRAGFLDAGATRPMRVIDWTPAIPNDLIIAHGLIERPLQHDFAQALRDLCSTGVGKSLAHQLFQADDFVPYLPEMLTPVARLVNVARANGFLPFL